MKKLGNVLIFGDSYSTFRGALTEGLRCYYGREEIISSSGVKSVEDTWWWQLINKTDSTLILNSSFSGSTVCTTERPEWEMTGSAFVYRMHGLVFEEFFARNKIDTFLIFGGTNDSWTDAPIGSPKYEDLTLEDLKEVLPAFCQLMNLVKNASPNTKIYLIINDGLKEEIVEGIKEIASHYGEIAIELNNIDKINNHPTAKGMKQICEQILNKI